MMHRFSDTNAHDTRPSAVFPTDRHLRWALSGFLLYFGLRLVYLAVNISPAIPPDELSHFGICKVFSTVFLLPENSAASYPYGLVTNVPWLYYWIMGKLLLLNFSGIQDLVWLRLMNIPFAFATVWFVWRTLRLLTDDRLTRMLLVAALTNTMMFTFLSACVSYDNLTNLLAAMAVYYLLAFFRARSGNLLALSLICQLAGCLTKSAFLPLVVALQVSLVMHEFSRISSLPASVVRYLEENKWRGGALLLAILAGLVLNLQLYGGNYRQFGKLKLEMYEVLPFESVMQNSLAARNMILTLFQEGRVTKEQAIAMASRIEHPGERIDAITSVKNYEKFREGGKPPMGLARYTLLWVQRMASGIFGVQGRLAIPATWPAGVPLTVLGITALAAWAIRWRPRDAGGIPAYLAMVAGFYTMFLLYWVNYRGYLENGSFTLALQGRYLFPVLGPVYLLAVYYLMRLFSDRHLRLGIFAAAAIILVLSDFPLFLARITPAWYVWPSGG